MTVSLKHLVTATGTDAGNGQIGKAQWNDEHTLTLASQKLLGRASSGTGPVEEIDLTTAGRALLDDASAADQRDTLGLGSLSTQSANGVAITGGTITGITDLAVSDGGTGASDPSGARANLGLGSLSTLSSVDTAQITNSAVTYAKMQNVSATDKLLGRSSAGAGIVEEITCTAAGRALLDDATAAAQLTTLGLSPSSGSNEIGFLQAGTGAVARTVQSKLREYMSVFDFMTSAQIADVQAGTALVDVSVPLQAAIDAACAAQVQLFWPKGIYLIGTTLTVRSKTNWLGEGGGYSIIKQNGTLINMINDDNSNMEDVIVDGIGFDFNGYNIANFGTAMQFNAASHTRFRIVNTRVFDSNYPGNAITKQRQGIFMGQNPTDVWVTDNDLSAGARIKIGYGGKNVFIQRNKLFYINDNAITMAMLGTAAVPAGQYTETVHIEDNIILDPTGNGIFIGADGTDKDDPAMYIKNISIARNILYYSNAVSEGTSTPRFIIFTVPSGGGSDIAINDNICVISTAVIDAGFSEGIRIGSAGATAPLDRLSIRRNKVFCPYARQSAIYVGCLHVLNDLVIADNELNGYVDCIYIPFSTAYNRPVITGNTIRNASRGFRIGGNPTVVSGLYARNRISSPLVADLFASTNPMEWRIESNEVLDSAAGALEINGAGTKDFYIINNDYRGAATAPITFTSGAVLSGNAARLDNLGDTSLTNVTAASTLTIPNVRVVNVQGTTNIDTITATGRAGQVVTLRFGGVLTVNDDTGNLRLAGNFTTSNYDTLTLLCTGAEWEEVSRSSN